MSSSRSTSQFPPTQTQYPRSLSSSKSPMPSSATRKSLHSSTADKQSQISYTAAHLNVEREQCSMSEHSESPDIFEDALAIPAPRSPLHSTSASLSRGLKRKAEDASSSTNPTTPGSPSFKRHKGHENYLGRKAVPLAGLEPTISRRQTEKRKANEISGNCDASTAHEGLASYKHHKSKGKTAEVNGDLSGSRSTGTPVSASDIPLSQGPQTRSSNTRTSGHSTSKHQQADVQQKKAKGGGRKQKDKNISSNGASQDPSTSKPEKKKRKANEIGDNQNPSSSKRHKGKGKVVETGSASGSVAQLNSAPGARRSKSHIEQRRAAAVRDDDDTDSEPENWDGKYTVPVGRDWNRTVLRPEFPTQRLRTKFDPPSSSRFIQNEFRSKIDVETNTIRVPYAAEDIVQAVEILLREAKDMLSEGESGILVLKDAIPVYRDGEDVLVEVQEYQKKKPLPTIKRVNIILHRLLQRYAALEVVSHKIEQIFNEGTPIQFFVYLNGFEDPLQYKQKFTAVDASVTRSQGEVSNVIQTKSREGGHEVQIIEDTDDETDEEEIIELPDDEADEEEIIELPDDEADEVEIIELPNDEEEIVEDTDDETNSGDPLQKKIPLSRDLLGYWAKQVYPLGTDTEQRGQCHDGKNLLCYVAKSAYIEDRKTVYSKGEIVYKECTQYDPTCHRCMGIILRAEMTPEEWATYNARKRLGEYRERPLDHVLWDVREERAEDEDAREKIGAERSAYVVALREEQKRGKKGDAQAQREQRAANRREEIARRIAAGEVVFDGEDLPM